MMLRYIRTTWLHVLLVLLALFLDGGLALVLAPVLFKLPVAASPYLTILIILMPVLSGRVNQIRMRWIYLVALMVGVIFDVYYLGLIGISTIGFPLTVWVAANIQRFFPNTMLWSLGTWFLAMCAYLIYDYLAFGMVNLANVSVVNFVVFHLFPTLLVNLAFFLVLYNWLDHLYQGTKQPDIASYNVDRRDFNSGIPLPTRSRKRRQY